MPDNTKQSDERIVKTIMQQYSLPELFAHLLALRGINSQNIDNFLNPKIKNLMPDPNHLKDMAEAAKNIANFVVSGKKIAIFGDYDVDGATSSSLLKLFLMQAGIDDVMIYIPDRILEGYGPNKDALISLYEQGYELVITVDCGTVAFEPLKAASERGLNIIVIDHHLGIYEKPDAIAIVNPNRFDETTELKNLAAVGVSFLLAISINRYLRENGWYESRNEPNLLQLLDLVALGTVCDMMQLTGLNRAFVKQGLKIMAERKNLGLATLADIAGVNERPNSFHLGFLIGPRINAGGRVGDSSLGARLLTSQDEIEVMEIAQKLDKYNQERKAIESLVVDEAIAQVESTGTEGKELIFASGTNWHPGVIGIVASKLKERFNLPVAVLSISNGVAKASARSIDGIDFGKAISNAVAKGLLMAGGGHAMAAGFTVQEEKIEALYHFLSAHFADNKSSLPVEEMADATITIAAINQELIEFLRNLEPYGNGNPEPLFLIKNAVIINPKILNGGHINFIMQDKYGKASMQGICFSPDEQIASLILGRKELNLSGYIKSQIWQGAERKQLILKRATIPT